ncbi:MAG: AAA family ATPase [Deltaproteobacteria bacterium]|nr:AAA family ATPase [Deltaproteobacteria bacterium]MBV9524857.1 AAA family ATPase [Candidatus Dormibacteraeota bacterium]
MGEVTQYGSADTVASMTRILCPVLVGRQAELAQLDAAVRGAQQGRGGVVVVSGPAGVGKSRLVDEAARSAPHAGSAVLVGRCLPSALPDPYRPIREALLALPPETAVDVTRSLGALAAALSAIVPTLASGEVPVKPESPVVLAEALLRALTVIGGATAAVLVVEDIQWADAETLHAIEYMAHHASSRRVAAVCTMRSDTTGDAARVMARLEAQRLVNSIRLAPLTAADAVQMAARMLETEALDDELTGYILESADGLPFLIEDLLATAVASGAVNHEGAIWHLSAPQRLAVPESFAVSVRERLHAMGPEERHLLGAAALFGRAFDWELAARAADCTLTVAQRALTRALNLQLLAMDGGGYQFRHALTRDALIEELLPHERVALATACLAALESTERGGSELHLAADLALLANRPERAASLLLQAGSAALARGALESATAALRRAEGLAVRDSELRAGILEALMEVVAAAGDMAQAREVARSLIETLGAGDAPSARTATAHLLLARCAVTATHFEVAREELERAEMLAQEAGDRALAARIIAVAAHLAAGEGKAGTAETLARHAAAEAEVTRQPEIVCEALEVVSRCARMRDLEEARRTGERMLVVAETAGLAFWRMRALYQIGIVEMFRSYRVDTLLRAQAEAERLGAAATTTHLDLEISAALEAQHRHEEARARCERCIEMAGALELRGVEAVAHAFIAIIEASRGSRRTMEAAIQRASAVGGDDAELNGALWGDARAIASLATEDRSRAVDELREAAAIYATAPASVLPRLGAALLTVVDAVEGREPDYDAATGATMLNAQGAGYVACAEAVMLGRRGLHAEARAAVDRADQHLVNCPWYRNVMHRLVAEAALQDGWGEPVTWLTEAAAYFEDCGNERLAAACRTLLRRAGSRVARPTRGARSLPASLREAGVTQREAEVLALLGEGLTNREIAERLFLSERTVEQHVAWLKQKLGTRTRAQLAIQAASEFSLPG